MKKTKRALMLSCLCLLLCVSMLIGSTFAWFTDTASTGVNTIQSGTLDIRLTDLEGNDMEGQTLNWVNAQGETDILWEPGCTFITEPVRLWNYSNLSIMLDYAISGFTGDLKLLEALEYKLAQVDDMYDDDGKLLPYDEIPAAPLHNGGLMADQFGLLADWGEDIVDGETVIPVGVGDPKPLTDVCIVAHMREDAGNEYQGLTLTGAAITFIAKQYTWESDSYDNQYDADADYPYVSVNGVDYLTIEEAIAAAKPGDTVTLKGDIVTKKQIVIDKDLTLDLGGYTIVGTDEVNDNAVLRICSPDANTEINVTINATLGGIKSTGGLVMPLYVGHVEMGKTNVTINGGDFESAWRWAVYQNNGTCTINGGTFRADGQSDTANGQPVYNSLVLDNFDSTPELTGKYVINGGKFYGFNPACLSVNVGDHHDHDSIAAGKVAVLGLDGWFTITEGTLTHKIVCNCSKPASSHEHCFTSYEQAQLFIDLFTNCEYDTIVEIQ